MDELKPINCRRGSHQPVSSRDQGIVVRCTRSIIPTAVDLRARFHELPKADREVHQDFSIRVWRALSWMERAEALDAGDIEGRFISCWIGINALYARIDDHNKPWGDREALGTFLTRIYKLDSKGRFRKILVKRQTAVLGLIDDKYLCSAFWSSGGSQVTRNIRAEVQKTILSFRKHYQLPILRSLFERLYVMRNQVFHGASTKGSRLNRRALRACGNILADMLSASLSTMIDHGIHEDWGSVCFPPDGE